MSAANGWVPNAPQAPSLSPVAVSAAAEAARKERDSRDGREPGEQDNLGSGNGKSPRAVVEGVGGGASNAGAGFVPSVAADDDDDRNNANAGDPSEGVGEPAVVMTGLEGNSGGSAGVRAGSDDAGWVGVGVDASRSDGQNGEDVATAPPLRKVFGDGRSGGEGEQEEKEHSEGRYRGWRALAQDPRIRRHPPFMCTLRAETNASTHQIPVFIFDGSLHFSLETAKAFPGEEFSAPVAGGEGVTAAAGGGVNGRVGAWGAPVSGDGKGREWPTPAAAGATVGPRSTLGTAELAGLPTDVRYKSMRSQLAKVREQDVHFYDWRLYCLDITYIFK